MFFDTNSESLQNMNNHSYSYIYPRANTRKMAQDAKKNNYLNPF